MGKDTNIARSKPVDNANTIEEVRRLAADNFRALTKEEVEADRSKAIEYIF